MSAEVTLTGYDAVAVITEVGACLRAFDAGGVPHLETYPAGEPSPMGSGNILVPWPNRTAGATWSLDGVPQHLEVTEPARGNASHGLVRKREWSVVERAGDAVTLAVTVDEAPGWPFRFRTTITYALGGTGLTVTHGVENLGDRPMPFGVGAHPYPRPGRADLDDCDLVLAARTHLPVDPESMIPTGPAVPAEPDGPLRGRVLDDAFGGCEPGDDGLVRHRVTGADGGVEVWADPDFRWVQVFTPPSFPGRDGRVIAVEPMTCPPDALNSGVDLLSVAPGARWSGRWGITPLGSSA